MKKEKHIFHPEIVECPYCGCKIEDGFEIIGKDEFSDDEYIREKYSCPKCNRNSTRCYEFYAWENDEGEEIDEDF